MSSYEIGDLVWAKMKGFPFWPAKVEPEDKSVKKPTIKKPMQYVFFFGSKNFAWILEDNILPYEENKSKFESKNQTGAFKAAVQDVNDYILDHPQKERIQKSNDDSSTTNGIRPSPPLQVNHAKFTNSAKHTVKKITKLKRQGAPIIKVVAKRPKQRRLSETSSTSSSSFKGNKVDKYAELLTSFPQSSTSAWSSPIKPYSNPSASSATKSGLLTRPAVAPPVSPEFIIDTVSDILKQKNVQPSSLEFGFLGVGIMGRGIVKNLLNSGHKVCIWNRHPDKCDDFKKANAVICLTPADVVTKSDIIFSCLSDPNAAKAIVFGNCGVLQEITPDKGYVEITSIDPETSKDIAEAITARGGRYLEAPVSGSRIPAERGTLIILAAGDRGLFKQCESCFQAIGKHAFYLGEVGNGSKMNLVLHMIMGVAFASLAEAMALAQRVGLSQKNLLEIIELGPLNCTSILEKGKAILEGNYTINMALQHMQNDLHLALGLGNQVNQTMPTTAAANEVFKHAKSLGYGEHDVSAVYHGTRF